MLPRLILHVSSPVYSFTPAYRSVISSLSLCMISSREGGGLLKHICHTSSSLKRFYTLSWGLWGLGGVGGGRGRHLFQNYCPSILKMGLLWKERICSPPFFFFFFFFFFLIWVLRPFQEYFTYIEPIVHRRWAKTGEPGEKPPDHP